MRPGQRGFALLIVLWSVGFLALLGTRIVADGRTETRLTDNLKQQAVLQAAADGTVAEVAFLILCAKVTDMKADGEERAVRVGQTLVLVRVENEDDRVNLNRASRELLQALLTEVGNSPVVAAQLATAILNWRHSERSVVKGAKAADYRAAGLGYGPPETPFQSVDELTRVLGISPELAARLVPHLTVLTEDDPDGSTRDPIVARALANTGDNTTTIRSTPLRTLRIQVAAVGQRGARYDLTAVVRAEFQGAVPRIEVLLREWPQGPNGP